MHDFLFAKILCYSEICLWTENGQLREHLRFEICRVYLRCFFIREDVREFGRRGGLVAPFWLASIRDDVREVF